MYFSAGQHYFNWSFNNICGEEFTTIKQAPTQSAKWVCAIQSTEDLMLHVLPQKPNSANRFWLEYNRYLLNMKVWGFFLYHLLSTKGEFKKKYYRIQHFFLFWFTKLSIPSKSFLSNKKVEVLPKWSTKY